VLEEGRVKLIRQSSDKRVQLLSIHAYGELLGEIPVFDPHGGPRTASAVAMTNGTRVVWLEHDALFAWLDEHPRVAVDMLQVLAHRMRDNNERISDLVFMDVPGRLAKTLLNLASRFGEPVEAGLKVPHDLTQEEMAQLVGSSRETVNKALMDFANRGWIAREGRSIVIYQPGMLIRRSRR
jgi:CRP-like cAMP-binding protein